MARAEWTYQISAAGAPREGIEDYVAETADGTRLGKVTSVLRHDGMVYVAVEEGTPPLRHELKAYEWGNVAEVDHGALTVRLRLSASELGDVLELDPDRGVESGDAEAERVTDLPAELTQPTPTGGDAGPVDRPRWAVALALGALGLFSLLVAVIVIAAADSGLAALLFVVPGLLLAAAGLVGYIAFRDPYEPRRRPRA